MDEKLYIARAVVHGKERIDYPGHNVAQSYKNCLWQACNWARLIVHAYDATFGIDRSNSVDSTVSVRLDETNVWLESKASGIIGYIEIKEA